ncbi:MAG TPA: glycosyltransferase [Solirubrobacteraceae bacterium]|nr:glycosyltransferase [Solirubrobacteraceae bacterium]
MRVAVVTEFYPRAHDPVLGIWAHRQVRATLEAGAEPSVFVLHRIVPPRSEFTWAALRRLVAQPRAVALDGIPIRYVRYVSPPRGRTYASWGAWAMPALKTALRAAGPFDLIHAHNAVPAGDAVLRAGAPQPLIVSVHGGDVLWTAHAVRGGGRAVSRVLDAARLVLANSEGIAALARTHGARDTRVVGLGTDLPERVERTAEPLLVTVGHLVARKRHADVIRALARLPADVRYLVIGDGPERPAVAALAAELGVRDRVEFAGQLEPELALRRARTAWLFVMPSVAEAFGVAYIEAMAGGVPAIGAVGEPGPEEIAAAGPGIELVPSADPPALADRIATLVNDRPALDVLAASARTTVAEHFSWERCGQLTLAAYREALGERSGSHAQA